MVGTCLVGCILSAKGIAGWLAFGRESQIVLISVPGVLLYTAFPYTMIMLGVALVAYTRLFGWLALPVVMLAAVGWEMGGSWWPWQVTPLAAWVMWGCMAAVLYGFLRRYVDFDWRAAVGMLFISGFFELVIWGGKGIWYGVPWFLTWFLLFGVAVARKKP